MSTKAMTKARREALDRALKKLCADLQVDEIIPHLISMGKVSDTDRERVESKETRRDRVIELVSTLKTKGGDAFDAFVEGLRGTTQAFLAEDILEEEKAQRQEDQGDDDFFRVDVDSDDDSDGNNSSDEPPYITFDSFLQLVGLKDKYPCQLTLDDLCEIKDPNRHAQNALGTSLHELFWEKLGSLDYRACSKEIFTNHSGTQPKEISVRDFIFTMLHCCDTFLRQDILEKMSACQLAVPILLHGVHGQKSTFLIWSLRRIVKKWKKLNFLAVEYPIVTTPVFSVAFMRIGEIRQVSKSLIINHILGPRQGFRKHAYFLSKEDDSKSSSFSQGCVEGVWYLPSNSHSSEKFRDVMSILNLRGDCDTFYSAANFCCKVANLCMVLVAKRNQTKFKARLTEMRKQNKNMKFIQIDDEKEEPPTSKRKYRWADDWLFVRFFDMNDVCGQISSLMSSECDDFPDDKLFSLEQMSGRCENVKVEDENNNFRKARKYVADICNPDTMRDGLRKFKTEAFPLQGMWLDLVKIDRESTEPDVESDKSVEYIIEEKKARELEQREKQLKRGLSPQVKLFKRVLDMVGEEGTEIWGYFSSYLREKLRKIEDENINSHRMKVSELQRQIDNLDQQIKPKLNESSGDVSTHPRRKRLSEDEKLRKDREKLKRSRQEEMRQCQDKSLSFEYFLRELGQWYEAYTDLGNANVDATIELLPALAARLLVNGHSIEIMDGESGRVPMLWVRRLLTDLIGLIEDAPILVLSVIGVQSSGKSTLLNTMFGVRFNVRAGMCTRGLFLRVLRVNDQYAKILKVKYVFLIDSEGIRSQERTAEDQYRFDNELVTLALCVSDVTILNISGENIGPDMTGLLQIAAHALIRMKRVDLHSHCRIVQQRVGDITAEEANKLTMTQIEDSLNKVISQVAEKEGFGTRYQVFSDVFELMRDQSGENLQYFPSLWTGRPMSPPNELYSERVIKVRERILDDVASRRIEPQFTVSTFLRRIQDVWMAVKHEKFLFNFTDSVKAIDFESLCWEFNRWVTEVKGNLMEKMSKWERVISMSKGEPDDMLKLITEQLRDELGVYEKALRDAFGKYVTAHPRKNTMANYNTWFDQTVKLAITDERANALKVVENHIKAKKIHGDREAVKARLRLELRKDIKTEAERLRDNKMGDEEISTHFHTMWNIWVERVEEEFSSEGVTDEKLAETIERSLLNITTDMSINQEIATLIEEEGGLKNHSSVMEWADYYPKKGGVIPISEWFRSNEENLSGLINESLDAIQPSKRMNKFDFDPVIREALNKLGARTFSSEPPTSLKAKIMLHIGAKIFEIVSESQRPYGSVMSVAKLLQEDIGLLLEDFRAKILSDTCVQRALVFAQSMLSNSSRRLVIRYITDAFVRALVPTHSDKRSLITDVLSALCRENTHDGYISFIGKHLEYVNGTVISEILLLSQQVSTDGELKMRNHANHALELAAKLFRDVIRDATEQTKSRITVASTESDMYLQWVKQFQMSLSEHGGSMSQATAEELLWYDVQDVEHFMKEMTVFTDTKFGAGIMEEMHIPGMGDLADTSDFLQKFDILQNIRSSIIDPKRICFEQCPFCGAPCANVVPRHEEHHALTHIPRGISGVKRRKRLTVDDCETCVSSTSSTYTFGGVKKPFMNYKDDYPSWIIRPKPDPAPSQAIYWKWVMAQHNESFAKHYGCEAAKIPPSWRRITQNDAMQNINQTGLSVTIDMNTIINQAQAIGMNMLQRKSQ